MTRGNKERNQRLRALRYELVHAAGCTEKDCCSVLCYRTEVEPDDWSQESIADLRLVRIPRSLRRIREMVR